MSGNTIVSSGYELLTTTKNGCTITWDIDINHLDNLSDNTLINKTENDIQVNLFATITYGTASSEEIKYQVLIEANTTNSDFEGYYSDIEDISGNALKLALRELITTTHTHKTSYVEFPELLNKIDRKIIIDHHRKAPDCIENVLISFHEVYASSTAELVTEIIQYSKEDIKGEIVLIISGAPRKETEEMTLEQAVAYANGLIAEGESKTSAAKIAAKESGFKKGDIYKFLVE